MRWRGHVFGQRSVGSSSSSALAWSWAVGRGVDADGVESGVAEQLSDDDEVGAAADEGGGEGCGRWFGRPGPALSAIWRKMPLVAPAVLSSVGLQALVAPFERIPVAPLIETEPFGKLSRRSASSRCLCCDALTATIGGEARPLSPHPDRRTQTWVGAKPLSECRNSATKRKGTS